MPKNLNQEEVEDAPVAEDVLLDVAADLVEAGPIVPAAAGPVSGKRALGVKEPIIFKWKLVGTSHNMALTLFKAVEREDVDAQFERTQREGYYTDLKILDADAKVEQPAQPKGTKKASPHSDRGGKGATATAARPVAAKRSSSPAAPTRRKPAPTKSTSKSEAKTIKKKSGGSSGGSKRTAKKK